MARAAKVALTIWCHLHTHADRMGRPTDRLLGFTAYHEAGHAVVARVLRRQLVLVSVRPSRNRLGLVQCGRHPSFGRGATRNRSWRTWTLEREIVIAIAGPIAEALARGRRSFPGAGEDAEVIARLLRCITRDKASQLELAIQLADKARELLATYWRAVEAVADQLVARQQLSGRELAELTKGFGIG